jgi:hypothetical protein
MMKHFRFSLALAMLCAALSTAMYASDNASLYLVQGIPGRDFTTTTDPAFPVDVLFNDYDCFLHGLAFGVVDGPLTFSPGTYDVKISVANTLAPCSNTPFIDSTIKLTSDVDVSAVIALSQTGTPTILTFANDFAAVQANMGRIIFAQAADASTVTVLLQNTATTKTFTYTVKPGAVLNANVPAGNYTVQINEGTTTLVPPTAVVLPSQAATLLYAVGEASNNSVTLFTRTVKDII